MHPELSPISTSPAINSRQEYHPNAHLNARLLTTTYSQNDFQKVDSELSLSLFPQRHLIPQQTASSSDLTVVYSIDGYKNRSSRCSSTSLWTPSNMLKRPIVRIVPPNEDEQNDRCQQLMHRNDSSINNSQPITNERFLDVNNRSPTVDTNTHPSSTISIPIRIRTCPPTCVSPDRRFGGGSWDLLSKNDIDDQQKLSIRQSIVRQPSFLAAVRQGTLRDADDLLEKTDACDRNPGNHHLTTIEFVVDPVDGRSNGSEWNDDKNVSTLMATNCVDNNGQKQHQSVVGTSFGSIRTNSPRSVNPLHKFITFFSNHNQQSNISSVRTRRSGMHSRDRTCSQIPIRADSPSKQGPLLHRQVALGGQSDASSGCSWMQSWAVLHGATLYLCPQLSSFLHDAGHKILSIPAESPTVDVRSAIVDIAYDLGDQNVFRLTTQSRTEHLLRTDETEDMLGWIDRLQKAGRTQVNATGADDTKELIMQRYKAKNSQITTPLAMKKLGCTKNVVDMSFGSSAEQTASTSVISVDGESEATKSGGKRWRKSKASKARLDTCSQAPTSDGKSAQRTKSMSGMGHRLADCPTTGEGDLVPLLIQLCVKVVEAHGIDTVGIYRIPGNTAAVNALRDGLTQGVENVDFSDPRWKDVNVVSSLLKMFLRKLPEPLLTDKLYPIFIDANRISGHGPRLKKLRHLVRKLPKSHYATLKYLFTHFRLIAANSHVNKMATRNLALMFGPSIVRPSDDNMTTMVTHMSDQCRIVESLINYCDWIFSDSTPHLDDEPPEAVVLTANNVENSSISTMDSSFSDMQQVLQRITRGDENSEKSKDSIVKSILNVRRNSKKDAKIGVASKVTAFSALTVVPPDDAEFHERNIDAEIACRLNKSIDSVNRTPMDSQADSNFNLDNCTDLVSTVAEMRRRRELNIYSVRRLFITGDSSSPPISPSTLSLSNDLSSHSHHLSLSGLSRPAWDVLSPETREKVRRMKVDSELRQLKYEERRQNAHLRRTERTRRLVERAYVKARDEVTESDDNAESYVSDLSIGSLSILPSVSRNTIVSSPRSTSRICGKVRFRTIVHRRHSSSDMEQFRPFDGIVRPSSSPPQV